MSTLQTIFNELDLRPANATPAALAAVTDLAIEIAREGREGRKIGTIFTVGAETQVLQRSRCLILDPMAGHPPSAGRSMTPNIAQPSLTQDHAHNLGIVTDRTEPATTAR